MDDAHSAAKPVDVLTAEETGSIVRDESGLFFLQEARRCIRVLHQQGSSWRTRVENGIDADAPVRYRQAAQALLKASETNGFDGLRQMLAVFVKALDNLAMGAAGVLAPQALSVLERSIVQMETLLAGYAAGLSPDAPAQILAELSDLRRQSLSQQCSQERDRAFLAGDDSVAREVDAGNDRSLQFQPPGKPSAHPLPEDAIDPELFPVFLEEGRSLVAAVSEKLGHLSSGTPDRAVLEQLRRPLHTLKGSARTAGALRLGYWVHELENAVEHLLDQFGDKTVNGGLWTSYDQVLVHFQALEHRRSVQAVEQGNEVLPAYPDFAPASQLVRVRAGVLDALLKQAGELSVLHLQQEGDVLSLRRTARELGSNITRLAALLRDVEVMAGGRISAARAQEGGRIEGLEEAEGLTRLQELVRTMAEGLDDTVLLQQQLLATTHKTHVRLQAQDRTMREFEHELLHARMVKFGSVEPRARQLMHRLVEETGKPLQLELAGAHVLIDRSILERLGGLLEHLLRNAAVHGIEQAVVRAAAGKPPLGKLILQARADDQQLLIVVGDDGGGLDFAAIREKARRMGVPGAGTLTDADLTELIFAPGFSTAAEVSALAGRGMGMDIVRAEAVSLGGQVSVQSGPGMGTRFTLHLPLTLAVRQVCLLRHGGQCYAIPTPLVVKVIKLRGSQLRLAMARCVIEQDGHQLQLYPLERLLGEPGRQLGRDSDAREASMYVLVVRGGGEDMVGIIAETVSGSDAVVVRRLGPQLDTMPGLLGVALLDAGEIAFVIDPLLIRRHGPPMA